MRQSWPRVQVGVEVRRKGKGGKKGARRPPLTTSDGPRGLTGEPAQVAAPAAQSQSAGGPVHSTAQDGAPVSRVSREPYADPRRPVPSKPNLAASVSPSTSAGAWTLLPGYASRPNASPAKPKQEKPGLDGGFIRAGLEPSTSLPPARMPLPQPLTGKSERNTGSAPGAPAQSLRPHKARNLAEDVWESLARELAGAPVTTAPAEPLLSQGDAELRDVGDTSRGEGPLAGIPSGPAVPASQTVVEPLSRGPPVPHAVRGNDLDLGLVEVKPDPDMEAVEEAVGRRKRRRRAGAHVAEVVGKEGMNGGTGAGEEEDRANEGCGRKQRGRASRKSRGTVETCGERQELEQGGRSLRSGKRRADAVAGSGDGQKGGQAPQSGGRREEGVPEGDGAEERVADRPGRGARRSAGRGRTVEKRGSGGAEEQGERSREQCGTGRSEPADVLRRMIEHRLLPRVAHGVPCVHALMFCSGSLLRKSFPSNDIANK